MAGEKEKIKRFFKENEQEIRRLIVEITDQLVRQPTVNAGRARLAEFPYLEVPGQEEMAARVVADWFDRWGISWQEHQGAPGRSNIIGSLPGARPVLMLGYHLDVVPPGDGWSTPEFEATLKGSRLHGRGVLDNKGPMAAGMVAAWMLKNAGVELSGTLQIAGLASEEFREPGEEDPGLEFMLKNGLLNPDMAVIPDIGENMKFIDIAEKGRAVFKISTVGLQAHGSTPDRGVNAVNMMANVLTAFEKLELPHEIHPVLGSPTQNLGVVRGGSAANIVPRTCEVELDVRYVPGQTAESIRELLQAVAEAAIEPYKVRHKDVSVSVVVDSASVPHAIDAEHPLVKAIKSSVNESLGFEPVCGGIGGGTFAKPFNLGGIPAVGFGPGNDDQFHVVDESIELEELVQFSLVAALLACDLLS